MIEQIMNIKECAPHQNGLKWLFLDLNSYFASVEQQEAPHLIGKPVAVLPSMTDATCAIAASYEAKAHGIKTGTKIYEAKKMCPSLVCVPARHDIYVDYHHKVLNATERCLPINKIWSIDEFDCLLMGQQRQETNAITIAKDIKTSINQHVGKAINCSIGIAPNSFLAKVATDIQKPDGLIILRPEDLPGRLLDLQLTDLPGINTRMRDRLWQARITTIDALWNTSPKECRAIWKNVQGERFWYWLHGYDVPYQSTKPSMVGHSRMLDPNMRHAEATRQMARRLLFKACTRLRRKELYTKNLTFKVRLIDGRSWKGSKNFPALQDPFSLLQHLSALWDQMIDELKLGGAMHSSRRMIFIKVSTLLHSLTEEGTITDDLFEQRLPQIKEQRNKNEKLTLALDHLQQKYSKEQVWLGVVPKTLAGHVGTKIAFSRVPDKDEFDY